MPSPRFGGRWPAPKGPAGISNIAFARADHEPIRTHAQERSAGRHQGRRRLGGSEEHTSELQSLMRISYAVFCLKKKKRQKKKHKTHTTTEKNVMTTTLRTSVKQQSPDT